MALETWLSFVVAAWLISLSPGPGAVSCMSAGMRHHFWRAAWNIVGLELGVTLLVAVVAAGLGAVLAASQWLFAAIKWAGVAYLVWLGINQWRAEPKPWHLGESSPEGRLGMMTRAFLINASNPKGIVFMLAVLPQFIDPQRPLLTQYLICLTTLLTTDIVVMCAYTLLASKVLRSLQSPLHIRWINRGFGSLFVGAGALLAGFRR